MSLSRLGIEGDYDNQGGGGGVHTHADTHTGKKLEKRIKAPCAVSDTIILLVA